MTEHSDTGRQTALRDRLNDAAEDFFPASPPYDAIVGDAGAGPGSARSAARP